MVLAFDRPEYGEWAEAAGAALRGKPIESLRTELPGGLTVEPLYVADAEQGAAEHPPPGSAPFTRGTTACSNRLGWEVRQRYALVGDDDALRLARRIERDLGAGLDAPLLTGSAGDCAQALRAVIGVCAERAQQSSKSNGTAGGMSVGGAANTIAVHLDARHLDPDVQLTGAEALLMAVADAGVDPASFTGSAGVEVPALAAGDALEGAGSGAAALFAAAQLQRWPHARFATADGAALTHRGASAPVELAGALRAGAQWLRLMDAEGVAPADAARTLEFCLAGDAHFFTGVAKLRALRWCWAQVLDACGAQRAAATTRVHATTNLAMLAARSDVEVNVLRAASAAFAAAVGGADAITVEPADSAQVAAGWPSAFDREGVAQASANGAALDDPSSLGTRLARNTQLVLAHEANAADVIDAAGGSWFVESLTRQLAEQAWQHFQLLEAGDEHLEQLVERDATAGLAAIDDGSTTMVGVTGFVGDEPADPPGELREPVAGTYWHTGGWFDRRWALAPEQQQAAA